jgi:hypothetical protein
LLFDSGADVATLYLNGVAGTGGATLAYTSFTLASNVRIGQLNGNASTGETYDDFLVYLSLQDPATLYTAFQSTPSPLGGSLAQAAIQAQGVYLDTSAAVINFGVLNGEKSVVANGAVAIVFQIHCQNVSDCDPTAFKLVYSKNQTASSAAAAGTLQQVPDTETADGIWMWGLAGGAGLNAGVTTARLTGSCTVTNGSTQLTTSQTPNVDLPQDGCVMLRYIVRVGNMAGSFYELRLLAEGGSALSGGYVDARISVVGPMASGF